MTKNIIIIVVSVLVGAGIVFGVGALRHHGWKHGFCHSPEKRIEFVFDRLTKKLDLTREQAEKVNKIKAEVIERTKTLREERKSHRGEMAALIKGDTLTEEMVNKFIDKRKAAMEELRPFFVKKIVELHGILTPQQRIKLAEKLEKFHNRCR